MPKGKSPTQTTPKRIASAARTRNIDWKPKFIEALKSAANVRLACLAVGIDRYTAYEHRKSDKKFAVKWKIALADACDGLEAEAWRRARNGVNREHSHYFQGRLVGKDVITEYSDTLLIFLLKAHRPKKYREKFSVEFDLAKELQKKMNELGLTEEQIRQNATLAPIFARAGLVSNSGTGNGAVGQA